jgi:hypothetical protein
MNDRKSRGISALIYLAVAVLAFVAIFALHPATYRGVLDLVLVIVVLAALVAAAYDGLLCIGTDDAGNVRQPPTEAKRLQLTAATTAGKRSSLTPWIRLIKGIVQLVTIVLLVLDPSPKNAPASTPAQHGSKAACAFLKAEARRSHDRKLYPKSSPQEKKCGINKYMRKHVKSATTAHKKKHKHTP